MYEILPELTQDYVFSKIPQEQIFEKYLGVPVQFKRAICSPLRKDDNPTCRFKYVGNTLLFTDFAGYFKGNCVQLVMKMFNLRYYDALKKILNDNEVTITPVFTTRVKDIPYKAKLAIKRRVFNEDDKKYWLQFAISSNTLMKFKVYPIQILWINEVINYNYKKDDPAYAYQFEEEYKIYFPFRKEFRFISNTQAIQGYEQLPTNHNKSRNLIITKSLKDIMVLYELGIPAIALQSEVVMPTDGLINELKQRFKKIYLFYDFDLTGIRTSNKIRRKYRIPQLFLTNGRFGSIDYGAKDISDYVKRFGINKAKELINSLTGL